jgi:hypothetical protein
MKASEQQEVSATLFTYLIFAHVCGGSFLFIMLRAMKGPFPGTGPGHARKTGQAALPW